MTKNLAPLLLLLFTGVVVAAGSGFAVSSDDLSAGAAIKAPQVYAGYGCSGGNVSPQLAWHGAPAGTRSYAITLFDPDAAGDGWWHWLVTDIPATITRLTAGAGGASASLPHGARAWPTDFGTLAYGGPCPPPDDDAHHYELSVYALDVARLPAEAGASREQVLQQIHEHALARARLTATYDR